MTVDESPVSPPSADPTPSQSTLAKKAPHPDQISTQIPDGRPLPVQQLQQHHKQQQQQPDQERPITFEDFMHLHPKHAENKLEQLAEISGIKDRGTLMKAFNETRVGNYEFNITAAIDWILNLQSDQSKSSFLPEFGPVEQTRKSNRMSSMSPTVATHTPLTAVISESSNTFATGAAPGVPPNSPNSAIKPLVDLTETSPGGNKDNIDLDLEKAIKLSLEEANRSSAGFGAGGISQEEQDVSRALEASLMETQLGGGKRKRNENWIDPLNPHDRERNGIWPVGLKNVGQTCWFSAVIQSLFYLPAFRSLVLNYRPPISYTASVDAEILEDGDSNKKASVHQSAFDDRQRKIIEFMLELRRLFALMVASQRKYVDPSRAVDILRGSIGTNGSSAVPANLNNSLGGLSNLGMSDNDQQDVSEFTHIVLEWVEEAFKEPEAVTSSSTSKSGVPEMMDEGSNDQAEKENSEEKDLGSGSSSSCNNAKKSEKNNNADDNPMAKLFYGKVLTEGSIQGELFSRVEAFGQWPLQVNSFTHIHDSLENSTAHEFFNVSATGVETDDSGQERWFTQLPPVLFLELSRFQYNTERRVAEKIHNRLEFPDSIYMDRYMTTNKMVTRTKRELVRALKEKRRLLKERLDKFTSYGGGQEVTTSGQEASSPLPNPNRMSLPEVLQYTLSFAMSGNNAATAAVPSMSDTLLSSPASKSVLAASSVMMQVDSPCHSPKMTPASSLSNLTVTSSLPSSSAHTATDQDDCPMEVEGCDETHHQVPSSVVEIDVPIAHGCDPKSPPISSTSDAMAHTTTATTMLDTGVQYPHDPAPRSISEVEMRVLQNCLNRWKREVEEDMYNLESSIELIDKAIEEMYDSVEELRRLEFSLHAVMVHEGSIDSGHYWAYVRDHRRKVWLKFNDNTVSEVTWDELLKESVGGHSNTSAYSLVYIDASKPELLMDAEDNVSVCEEVEERMDDGRALETLLKILPEDLSDFVNNDNDAFRQEIINWDKEQLEKQRAALEAAATAKLQKQQQTEPMSTSSDPNNDVQVVQEKLTHTNTHARLSLDLSTKVIRHFENVLHDKGGIAMVSMCTDKTVQHYLGRISKTPEVANQPQSLSGIGKTSNNELAPSDIRLESFLAYLLKNGLPSQSALVELAALEQFAHPGIDNNESILSTIRKCAEQCLHQKRQRCPEDAKELREWHQIYHWFRRSAHCFVNGMEAFHVHKFDRALDLFTEAYQYTLRVQDTRPGGPLKTLRIGSIVRFLCLVLPEVNFQLIKQFQLGEEIPEVVNLIQQLVVPGLAILQTRANAGNSDSAAHTLEAIRSDWCALLAEAKEEARTALADILTVILDTEPQQIPVRLSKNGEFVNLNSDLKLSSKYREMVAKLQQELTSDSQVHGIQEN